MGVWDDVDLDDVAARAGNVHLAGVDSGYYASLRAQFPTKRDMARALFLGALGVVKLLAPETAGQLDADAATTRWDDHPFDLAMRSVQLVDHVDPKGSGRPGRLEVVQVLWPEELAAL
jgi:hypothetical protein